jgi:hypothetical protein
MNRIFDRIALFVTGTVVALIKAVPLRRRRRTPSTVYQPPDPASILEETAR